MLNKAVIFFLVTTALMGCTSEEERNKKENARYEACMERYTERCKKACSIDPVLMYCGSKGVNNIIGSGCKTEIEKTPFYDREAKCISSACNFGLELIRACRKESQL
ncbi:hypothetical protein SAMN02745127_01127 [Oceanospirillum multiglobuliferum]|uniref:Lipoprotein n=1 Tax=Oceanospirillum multiglobuliferum TaxID=64969 RepID=A0A1T4NJ96_9GAMM|nr:hypothetical protein [Oceanospirillum multiglobuliferum]OPX55784.1 hypothetical protein BTE48_07825 [Oceanospirillum multiglobuliferum]SJZ79329.1 hypothetical protein SAMN02745127_01127 [Oceanospirillum multiglobuliferum]